MSTIYTLNGKVLKNSATDKWLIKAVPPPPEEVTIGTQTWKTKNLAIDDGGTGISTKTVNYGQGDVVEYYYTFDAAVRIANSISGWHIPTREEWETLSSTVGTDTAGTKLKSTYGWTEGNGTDNYLFSVLPTGVIYSGSFALFGSRGAFWTTTVSSGNYYRIVTFNTGSSISFNSTLSKVDNNISVRLIKDA